KKANAYPICHVHQNPSRVGGRDEWRDQSLPVGSGQLMDSGTAAGAATASVLITTAWCCGSG
ncbi:MAG: hypothetical protein OEQ18_05620, partial [Gammaproteobacteria bacterium]|nr:hypothetical protein [Gammaproteobacteria bacterium]